MAERSSEYRESLSEEKKSPKSTREMIFLAEQAAEAGLKVLPGEKWALHYPINESSRAEKLQGLLDRKYTASEVARDISPDALFYNTQDIKRMGLEKVSARIRDLSAHIVHYDHLRFAKFIESMRGKDVSLEELSNIYDHINQTRTQKKVRDAYGHTGRKQIEGSLRQEAKADAKNIKSFSRIERVLKTLKTNWLKEDLGLISGEERDRLLSELSGEERKLFKELQSSYRDYMKDGQEKSYRDLVQKIRDGFSKIKREIKNDESSEGMEELEKELEQYKDEAVPPGAPEDPAIPPEDSDEYHTPPPPASSESKEKMSERPIYTIEPPLGGYYASGRKSYYDVNTKTWSKRKQLSSYSASTNNQECHTISGVLDQGLKSLPLPNGYALDESSLKYKGAKPKILRDQNDCFYLKVNGSGTFSVDFFKEQNYFINPPIPEDKDLIYSGLLSKDSEKVISDLRGSALQKAETIRQYILANHFYPGGGDLQIAQALQYKLRSEFSSDNYLQNIDSSEYLECYSANTLFIAMMRKVGVSARLVIGHKVEGSKGGKSAITQNTGHAWAEIWDGKMWRRFDATPNPKPEDQKKSDEDDKKSEKESADEAQDGGIDKPQEKEGQQEGEQKPGQKTGEQKGQQSSESKDQLDQMSEVSDSDIEQSESELEQAKKKMEQIEKQKKELDEKVAKAEKFEDLAELQKEIEESELFNDLKEDLQDKLEAKEEQMKDEIRDELDKMVEDGFMDEEKRDEILRELEQKRLKELDQLQKEIEQENRLYNEYENIKEEVEPLVDEWFKYFAERLPKKEEVSVDEDLLTRRGAFNRRSAMKHRNLIFGTVKNPREIKPSVEPRFMASILVDVSGSMAGEKLQSARKLLIFYSELFSRISEEFGYIRFSINIFSDSVNEIKGYDQDYDSPERYDFLDGMRSTVKARLMRKISTQGGTNMLDAIKKAAGDLNEEVRKYPDYASAFYFVGDGGDTCGNKDRIKEFIKMNDDENGFGEHMHSAILLGNESQRKELSEIFGDEHTNVAPNFEELIEQSMERFNDDIEEYLSNKTL